MDGLEAIRSGSRAAPTRDMVRTGTTTTVIEFPTSYDVSEADHSWPAPLAAPQRADLDGDALDPDAPSEGVWAGPKRPGWDEELELLRSLETLGARVERLPALRSVLRRAFEDGSFDLLHLVSHGFFGGAGAGDATAVFLDDGLFTAAELSPRMAGGLRRSAPLVIFNTCHCGRAGFSLTRLGSWGGPPGAVGLRRIHQHSLAGLRPCGVGVCSRILQTTRRETSPWRGRAPKRDCSCASSSPGTRPG